MFNSSSSCNIALGNLVVTIHKLPNIRFIPLYSYVFFVLFKICSFIMAPNYLLSNIEITLAKNASTQDWSFVMKWFPENRFVWIH